MKKLMLTETLNCVSGLNYGWRKFGGTMISCAALPPGENLNHSATKAPSGGGMSFIDLKGDYVVAQSGGGRSFSGKPK